MLFLFIVNTYRIAEKPLNVQLYVKRFFTSYEFIKVRLIYILP